jgi:hypothetical protein
MSFCSLSCTSTNHAAPPQSTRFAPDPARITMFYAAKMSVPREESTSLCYGVDNAAKVRLTPPVERVYPAFSHCISVSPRETTTYTLTAEDAKGQASSQAVTITVTAALPRFLDLSISVKEAKPGQLVAFCYKAKNAVSVHGAPGHFFSGGRLAGDCLVDNPRETTTYTLMIQGAGGETDEAHTTVRVRQP